MEWIGEQTKRAFYLLPRSSVRRSTASRALAPRCGRSHQRSGGPWRGERPVAVARARATESTCIKDGRPILNHFDNPDTPGIGIFCCEERCFIGCEDRASPSGASRAPRQPALPISRAEPRNQQRNMQTAVCGIEHL